MLGESQSGCLMRAHVSISEASFLSSESSAVVFFYLSLSFERDRNKHVPPRGLSWYLLGSFFVFFPLFPPPPSPAAER